MQATVTTDQTLDAAEQARFVPAQFAASARHFNVLANTTGANMTDPTARRVSTPIHILGVGANSFLGVGAEHPPYHFYGLAGCPTRRHKPFPNKGLCDAW